MRSVGPKGKRITLESPSEPGGASNTVTWTTVATVWAQMLGLGGAEQSGIDATADYRFILWYRNDVTPRWRIGIGATRKLYIQSVTDPDGLGYEMVILARETV